MHSIIWPGIYEKNVANSKIEKINGWAEFTGPKELTVNGEIYTAEHICIATGGLVV